MHALTAIEIRDKFLRGELSAVKIVQTFLDRIAKYDGQVGAFLEVYTERALSRAKTLDDKRAAGLKFGKLAAIPIAIKDNIYVKGEVTTCASKSLNDYKAPFDSTVVRLLESEDAIIIGKTNMDEFAMGSSTELSAYHKTHNPWNLKCSPGGSSGGSAAAVAARLCPIAIGSDTGGSIRQPASFCGVVGYKPTYGRVSRYGLVALASSLDQIGPMAVSVEDAALVMEVIGQHCEHDSTSIKLPPENYLSTFSKEINGLKIGVPWHFLEGLADDQKAIYNSSIEVLKRLGGVIVDLDLSILKYSNAVYYILVSAEASMHMAKLENGSAEAFGEEVQRRIKLGTYVLSDKNKEAYYTKAQAVRQLIIQSLAEAFQLCQLVAVPASPGAAFEIGGIPDRLQQYLADTYTIPANLGGLPAISVPGGFTSDHMPVGFQLLGPQQSDVLLMQAAYAYEQATRYNEALPEGFML